MSTTVGPAFDDGFHGLCPTACAPTYELLDDVPDTSAVWEVHLPAEGDLGITVVQDVSMYISADLITRVEAGLVAEHNAEHPLEAVARGDVVLESRAVAGVRTLRVARWTWWVHAQRAAGQELGVRLRGPPEVARVHVSLVKPGGVLAAWNRRSPLCAVERGDELLSCGAILAGTDFAEFVQLVQATPDPQLLVLRVPTAFRWDGRVRRHS